MPSNTPNPPITPETIAAVNAAVDYALANLRAERAVTPEMMAMPMDAPLRLENERLKAENARLLKALDEIAHSPRTKTGIKAIARKVLYPPAVTTPDAPPEANP